ncbi:hypothetical protein [Pseudophaeobacter sp.]|uniref:hypothetical protein n=1 Tax=Pseudophaeobacter sp. TaxID=1971739 RepID=UPI0032984AD1
MFWQEKVTLLCSILPRKIIAVCRGMPLVLKHFPARGDLKMGQSAKDFQAWFENGAGFTLSA